MTTAVIRSGSRGVVLALIFLWGCVGRPPAVEHEILARGSAEALAPSGALYRVIGSQAELSALYGRLHVGRLPRPEPPVIDFDRSLVLLVVMGRQPTAGFAIELAPPRLREATLEVPVAFRAPPGDRARATVITRPYVLSRVSRPQGLREVEFLDPAGELLRRAAVE